MRNISEGEYPMNPAVIGAATTLLGTIAGGGVAITLEFVKARTADRAARRDALLNACSNFTASVARARSLCYQFNERPEAKAEVNVHMNDARADCERLRLLIEAKEAQEAARMVVRHLYAIWKHADTGVDPRAAQYPGTTPSSRLRGSLTQLYIGVRREIGSDNPKDVFEEPED
jgi:hypothetical protein